MTTMLRAVGYTRVSTVEQARGGVSLDMQASRISQECAARRWTLTELYSDPGFSAARTDRPALARMLRALEAGQAEAVIVYRLDRLGRRTWWQVKLIEDWLKRGVRFVSLTENFDAATPAGRLQLTLLAGAAQYEHELAAERVRDALHERASKGLWKGRPPMGYLLVEGVLVPDVTTAPLVREAFRLYADEHISGREVAKRLTSWLGRRVTPSDFLRLIGRESYRGIVTWGELRFPGQHPALVSDDLWIRAQAIRQSRARLGRDRVENVYVLSGFLRCRLCGGAMCGNRTYRRYKDRRHIYLRYSCVWRSFHRCRGTSITVARAHRLFGAALRALAQAGADLGTIEIAPPEAPADGSADALRGQIAALPERRARLVDLAGRGLVEDADLTAALAALEREGEEKERALAELADPPAPSPCLLRRTFRGMAELFESDLPMQHRRDVLAGWLERVVITPEGEVRLRLRAVG